MTACVRQSFPAFNLGAIKYLGNLDCMAAASPRGAPREGDLKTNGDIGRSKATLWPLHGYIILNAIYRKSLGLKA
jgi:hypothetical protein